MSSSILNIFYHNTLRPKEFCAFDKNQRKWNLARMLGLEARPGGKKSRPRPLGSRPQPQGSGLEAPGFCTLYVLLYISIIGICIK